MEPTRVYAGFGRRWVASILDALILAAVGMTVSIPFVIISTVISVAAGDQTGPALAAVFNMIAWLINMVIGIVYYVYFIGKNGQTLGKKALGIKVIKISGEGQIGYTNAFLRESVGKFISGLIFFIGYLWMLWDKDKQTLHDKIAGTVVVKI